MNRTRKVYRLLGLARRAGAVAPGTDAVRLAVRDGRARLVLMAGDASDTQLAKIETAARGRPVPRATFGDRNALGAAIGHAPVSAVAVLSVPLAKEVQAELAALEARAGSLEAVVAEG